MAVNVSGQRTAQSRVKLKNTSDYHANALLTLTLVHSSISPIVCYLIVRCIVKCPRPKNHVDMKSFGTSSVDDRNRDREPRGNQLARMTWENGH